MRNFLTVLAVFGVFASLATCAAGKSAVHELEGLVWLLIAVVSFVGAGILELLAKPR